MTKVKVIFICLLNALFNRQIQSFSGDATSYGGSIGGFCGFKEVSKMHVALNSEQWGNQSLNCGRCVSISYKDSPSVIAMVTDKCPECRYGDLDLYTDLYDKIIKKPYGREKIKWDFANCPNSVVSDNIKLRIDNINQYWLSISPISMKCGIIKMEILFDTEWIEMDRNDDDEQRSALDYPSGKSTNKKNKMNGLFFIYHNFVQIPFQLKLTSMYNDIIITPKYNKIENILFTYQQFKCIHNEYNEQNNHNNQTNHEPDCNIPMPVIQQTLVEKPSQCICK